MRAFDLVAAMAAIAAAQTAPAGWPQYLGPHRNGTTTELDVPAKPTLVEAWRRTSGAAMSAVVVSGGRAFTLESDGEDDYLLALDAASGKDVWRARLGKTHADAVSNGPGSTPAVAGDLVLVMGSGCTLAALHVADGRPAWSVDFGQTYKTRFATRNSCFISPLVHDGLVIMPTGSLQADRVVALDAATGKPRWSAADVEGSLNTNTSFWNANGTPQLLYHYVKPPGLSGLAAIGLADGRKVWALDAESGMSNTAPMPLGNGRVLMQTWQGSYVLDASSGAPQRVWSNSALMALPVPAVAFDGHIYGFGGNSGEFLTCVEAATGTTKWTERIYRGAVSLAPRTLVIQSEGSGLLRLVAADPAKYRELARLQVFKPGATTLTPPTIAGGRIYVRNLEEIVAATVR